MENRSNLDGILKDTYSKNKKDGEQMAVPNAKAPVGEGGRFAALKEKLSGKVDNPGAVAASIGRKKYGKKGFQKLAAEGRKG